MSLGSEFFPEAVRGGRNTSCAGMDSTLILRMREEIASGRGGLKLHREVGAGNQ